MTSTSQFWLNWIAQLAIAVGTVAAVIVALYGGWLRARLVPPKLVLNLDNNRGVKAPVVLTAPNGSTRETMSRWYHVRVTNKRRWSPARQVQVFLLSVEEPDPVGQFKTAWVGELPIRWRDQEVKPLVRTLGYEADCDLCSVVKDKWVELHPLISVIALNARCTKACRRIVTLQARGLEADSNLLRVEIAWDGKWADDTEEMARHMVVEDVSNTT